MTGLCRLYGLHLLAPCPRNLKDKTCIDMLCYHVQRCPDASSKQCTEVQGSSLDLLFYISESVANIQFLFLSFIWPKVF